MRYVSIEYLKSFTEKQYENRQCPKCGMLGLYDPFKECLSCFQCGYDRFQFLSFNPKNKDKAIELADTNIILQMNEKFNL